MHSIISCSVHGSCLNLLVCTHKNGLGLKNRLKQGWQDSLRGRQQGGALCEPAFQLMPTPHMKCIIVVSKFKSRLILHVFNVEDVEDAYSSSVYLIQTKKASKKMMHEWIHHVPDPQNRQRQQKPFLFVQLIFY